MLSNIADVFVLLWISAGTLLYRSLLAAAFLLFLIFVGSWLPALVRISRDRFESQAAAFLALATGGGVMACISFWTASLYLSGSVFAGTLALFVLGGLGLIRFSTILHAVRRSQWTSAFFAATGFAVMLAIWHWGCTELPYRDSLAFCDRTKDLASHVYSATLVREGGLPMINLDGSPDNAYHNTAHTGLFVLWVGASSLTGLTLYQSAQCCCLLGYSLIVWSALGLVQRFRLPPALEFVAAVAPLLWASSIHMPMELLRGNLPGIFDPYFSARFRFGTAGGSMHHNSTQLWSIAMTSVALVGIDAYAAHRRRPANLFAAAAAIAISGWIKPTLAVLFGPALMIFLVLRRATVVEWAIVISVLALGVVVYLLPGLLVPVPTGVSWTVNESRRDILLSAILCTGLFGVSCFAVMARVRSLIRRQARFQELGWADLTVIAAVGGLIFASIFRAEWPYRLHGNQRWGFMGCAALFAPWTIVWIAGFVKSGSFSLADLRTRLKSAILPSVAVLMATVQLLTGSIYAVTYPTYGIRYYQASESHALQDAGRLTPAGTRFLLDPLLNRPNLVCYLGHPVLRAYRGHLGAAQIEAEQWTHLIEHGELQDSSLLANRDAVVIHTSRVHVREILAEEGWIISAALPGFYELWVNPSARTTSSEP